MKHFMLAFIALLFLTNTMIVSSMAAPCASMDNVVMSQMNDMPCHEDSEQNNNKPTGDHCDGVCLCIHTSASQIVLPNTGSAFNLTTSQAPQQARNNKHLTSLATSPPRRPPKLIS